MPPPDTNIAVDGPAAEVFRISPDEPWRVLRTKWRVAGLVPGPVEGGGRASGYFTGAAAVTIYRGDALPGEFHNDAFVADCGSNLIHRKKIRRDGLNFIAERPADEQRREFLASRDNWFRPVAMANGPDGALYVVDMYREVVEHPWSLPPELKSRIDLNSGSDRGRIYRVVPNNFQRRQPVRMSTASTADLVATLAHANGWHRDTAARLLVERNDAGAIPLLREAVRGSTSSLARVHALQLLQSAGALNVADGRSASRDDNPIVRIHAIRAADVQARRLADSADANAWRALLRDKGSDPDIRVRFQSALAASDAVALAQMIQRDVEEPWMRAAALNGLSNGAANVFAALAGSKDFIGKSGAADFLREAARIAGASEPHDRVALGLQVAAKSPLALTFASAFAAGLEQRGMTLASVDAKTFAQLAATARATATNAALPEALRIQATEFLGASRDNASQAALMQLLQPAATAPLQTAAVLALAKTRADAGSNVLAHWAQLAPPTRQRTIAVFAGRRATALALLEAMEQGMVQRAELSAAEAQRLTTHNDPAVRDKARQMLQRPTSQRREVIEKFRPALSLNGDAQRGHSVYVQRCASCHRAGDEGFAVGPDLASVASSGKEKLLTSILDPNAEVAAALVAYSVETKAGDSFLGVLAGDNPLAVLLKLPNGETARVLRESIVSMRASGQSLMPEGLEEGLSAQELSDLLEFVIRAKPGP
jgi:putative heme-binding domain-containing protein